MGTCKFGGLEDMCLWVDFQVPTLEIGGNACQTGSFPQKRGENKQCLKPPNKVPRTGSNTFVMQESYRYLLQAGTN